MQCTRGAELLEVLDDALRVILDAARKLGKEIELLEEAGGS